MGKGNSRTGTRTNIRRDALLRKIESLPKRKKGLRDGDVENPIPYAGVEMLERTFMSQDRWYYNKIGEKEIEIDKLETIQPSVNRNTLIRKIDESESTLVIPVVHIDGRYILQDGNHTVTIAKLKGRKKIKVTLYEYK